MIEKKVDEESDDDSLVKLEELGILKETEIMRIMDYLLGLQVDSVEIKGPTPMKIGNISKMIGSDDIITTSICMNISGQAGGFVLLTITGESIPVFFGHMLGKKHAASAVTTTEEASALKEVGNMISASNLDEISKRFNLSLTPSSPLLVVDSFRSVMDFLLVATKLSPNDYAVIDIVNITVNEKKIMFLYFLIPCRELIRLAKK